MTRGYRFRLEAVRRVRDIQEQQARAALAKARLDAERAEKETGRRKRRLLTALTPEDRAVDRDDWLREHDRRQVLGDAVLAAHLAELRAAELARTCLDDWEAAARELESLERLDHRHRTAWTATVDREEQRRLDEQATIRAARHRGSVRHPDPEGRQP